MITTIKKTPLIAGIILCTITLAGCTLDNNMVRNTSNTTRDTTTGQDHGAFNLDIPTDYTAPIDNDQITVNGVTVNLSGKKLQSGDSFVDVILDTPADKFDIVGTGRISDYTGYKVIETVPSLDTPVCTLQTKQLEAAATQFPNVAFIVVSNDTPFALKRFCLANKIENVKTLSDARTREFGTQNGFFMPQYGLLARTISIVDPQGKILYMDYAEEVTNELDIVNALAYLKNHLMHKGENGNTTNTGSQTYSYIGLSVDDAIELATINNTSFRLVEIDGQQQGITMDYRPGRINAVANNGIITSFSIEGQEESTQ